MEALWMAIGAAAAAVAAAAVSVMTARHKFRKEERSDALAEWREFAERQQRQIDDQHARISGLNAEVLRLHRAHARCQTENAELRGEIRLLQASVRRLQGLAGDEPPPALPALVIAGLDGVIRSASSAVAPLFHWLPKDLLGQHIQVLTPKRHRRRQADALRRAALTGEPPWPERAVVTEGLTREGQEVPVLISLSGWQTGKGEWLISAEIRHRGNQPDPGTAGRGDAAPDEGAAAEA